MRKFFFLIALVAFCGAVGQGLHFIKKGFSIRRVQASFQTQLEIWDNKAEIAIEQPFRYLGRGRQCFAFESLDGKYVLKLPRTDIYQRAFWMRTLPFLAGPWEARNAARAAKEKFILNSMRISYETLREETGVLALHFGQTEDLGKQITLIDPLGFTYRLPAHKTDFVIQIKHPLLMMAFKEALTAKDKDQCKRILDAFIDVIVSRGNKGIGNKDASFLRNYGFDGQKGFLIDIGTFYQEADRPASIRRTMHPVQSWLAKTDPEMLGYFNTELAKKMPRSE